MKSGNTHSWVINARRARPFLHRFTGLLVIATLSSCGGGDNGSPNQTNQSFSAANNYPLPPELTGVQQDYSAPETLANVVDNSDMRRSKSIIANTPNTGGTWSAIINWPIIPIHAVILPDGRVMSYGSRPNGTQGAYVEYDVWNPALGVNSDSHLTLPNGTATNIFCSSQTLLPGTGEAFIAGGDIWTGTGSTNQPNNNSNLFDYRNNTLVRGNNMNRARWYSSTTTLMNGEVYIQGGSGGNDFPEVRQSDGTFRLLTGVATSKYAFDYPRNWVAPDGRIFGTDGNGYMYYINPSNTGSVTDVGRLAASNAGSGNGAAMFQPGRILRLSSNSAAAAIIDINSGNPVVTQTESLSALKILGNATIMADGRVLSSGGSTVNNTLTGVSKLAEVWDPISGQWTLGPNQALARLYHSIGLLLPDATILVAGGGAPGPLINTNGEIYYPSYLYDNAGNFATRPVISAAPTLADPGTVFNMDVNTSDIGRVTLIRTGSVTHTWNSDQRFVDLPFRAINGGTRLSVQLPSRVTDTPPGTYMLFAFNSQGVPSVAKMVKVNLPPTRNAAQVPSLTAIANQSGQAGALVNVSVVASDPNGDVLTYTASGLPPGLTINPVTGKITGSPSKVGSYFVTVAANDGTSTASTSFLWNLSGVAPLVLNAPTPPGPVLSNTDVVFTAVANGINTRYSWNFGDGTPASPPSDNPTITHRYNKAGVFFVTVTATDDQGIPQTKTFLQIVQLAGTAKAAVNSSPLALQQPLTGNSRIWVVNPDNDTVSAFDTVSRNKLAEISVGAAPRTVAVANNGLLWVSNKQAASISVIDPASFTVTRTITLPPGSQPYGIVMSPANNFAYIALEASGQVLKFDTAAYTQTASLNVGNNPRHLAITGDGTSLYVSRFITPPLPGESTATVSTTLNGINQGAEVLKINTGTMQMSKTIVLAHSNQPDFENQGRGIPNYLGAPAISPDGTQAYIPSKQDNVLRGTLRDGNNLNFQNTVRAISSRVTLANDTEDLSSRIDHDNASVASAATYDPRGVLLFVALETSREVAILDAHNHNQLLRIDTGIAPQGLRVSPDSNTLYVSNFMDRNVGVYDLRPLLNQGQLSVPLLGNLQAVANEKLTTQVLRGKQLFYDARDTRLARDRYMSCATCHNDGGHDGRTWDLTGMGEGLRNTISLRGRGSAHGLLHWTGNFDEVQDFEGQIRNLAGGTGLLSDALFNAGRRSQPLGETKTGLSTDLDALSAYLGSLNQFDRSPFRNADGSLTTDAVAGAALFNSTGCVSCHGGADFTSSANSGLKDVGTLKASSGKRLGGNLTGLDPQTLRDAWATAPYLHDGSATTIEAAIQAHRGVTLNASDLSKLAQYVRQIGHSEAVPASTADNNGLLGEYYNSVTPGTGVVALRRNEAVNFDWSTNSPGAGVNADNFSVRWSGTLVAETTGTYQFQTVSDDGVRLWVNGQLIINNWVAHTAATDTSTSLTLNAGQRYPIKMEFYENSGSASAKLLWKRPGQASFVAIPVTALKSPSATAAICTQGGEVNELVGNGDRVSIGLGCVDNSVLLQRFRNGSFIEAKKLANCAAEKPGLSTSFNEVLVTYVNCTNRAVQFGFSPDAGQTFEWEDLGGVGTGAPMSWWRFTGTWLFDVVVRGTDNALWKRTWDWNVGAWSSWQSLGGALNDAAPVFVRAIPAGFEIQATSLTNTPLVKSTVDGVNWTPWQAPRTQTFCANEGERCNFTGSKTIRYGANGKFMDKVFNNGMDCNSSTFGDDPIWDAYKACYILN